MQKFYTFDNIWNQIKFKARELFKDSGYRVIKMFPFMCLNHIPHQSLKIHVLWVHYRIPITIKSTEQVRNIKVQAIYVYTYSGWFKILMQKYSLAVNLSKYELWSKSIWKTFETRNLNYSCISSFISKLFL